jgi:hypothetical protein
VDPDALTDLSFDQLTMEFITVDFDYKYWACGDPIFTFDDNSISTMNTWALSGTTLSITTTPETDYSLKGDYTVTLSFSSPWDQSSVNAFSVEIPDACR